MKLSKPFVAALLVFAFEMAHAQLEITPNRLEIPANARAVKLELKNTGQAQQVLDVLVYDWIGNKGAKQIVGSTTTTDVVTKPRVTLAPGATATVRFFVNARKSTSTSFYRVEINDITPAPSAEPSTATPSPQATPNLRFLLNIGLPLIVVNKPGAAGHLVLESGMLRNDGDKHVRIKEINGLLSTTYLLPGETHRACFASKSEPDAETCTPVAALDSVISTDTPY